MKNLLLLLVLGLFMSGCQEVIDVSRLDEPYRTWAKEAAAIEGVDAVDESDIQHIGIAPNFNQAWEMVLDYHINHAGLTDVARGRLRIRLNILRMFICDGDSTIKRKFIMITRHEIRHGKDLAAWHISLHDSDPDHLMHDPTPCFPTDINIVV